MARRRSGTLGWVVLLLIGWGAYSVLSSRPSPPPRQDNDVIATPLFSRPASQTGEDRQQVPADRSRVLYVTATTLNVRAAPRADSVVLLAVPRGTSVVAVSLQDGWYEVKLTNGSTGWMNAAYLADAPPQARAQVAPPPPPPKQQIDRGTIIREIIAESIASYPGNCACPYNTDRAGRSCGRRSAWSKAGGYAPLCYPDDVTPKMISDYLARR